MALVKYSIILASTVFVLPIVRFHVIICEIQRWPINVPKKEKNVGNT